MDKFIPHTKHCNWVNDRSLKERCVCPVILQRTFNQTDIHGNVYKYWRVMSPWHKNYQSDLSVDGLKQWGIIK